MLPEVTEQREGVSAPSERFLRKTHHGTAPPGNAGKRSSSSGRVRFRPTMYGWILMFLLVWLPMTAVGSANNFLFIVFVLLLGLALVSHWLGRRNVRGVTLSRRLPDEIFAGTPFPIQYVVHTSVLPWGAVTVHFTEAAPLRCREPALFPQVRPGQSQVFSHMFTIASRGQHQIGPGVLESTFPFGLARYARTAGAPDTALVFPRIQAVREPIPLHAGGIARGPERADLFGTIPYHFREYAAGDPYKRIDWKKTARTGTLTTRVFSEEGSLKVVVGLPRNASEEAISTAASVVVHCGNLGIPVSLKGPGSMVEPGAGKDYVRKLLTILATWEKRDGDIPLSNDASGLIAEIDGTGNLTWQTSGGSRVA